MSGKKGRGVTKLLIGTGSHTPSLSVAAALSYKLAYSLILAPASPVTLQHSFVVLVTAPLITGAETSNHRRKESNEAEPA